MKTQLGQVNASTRAAEGGFNGLKFSAVHALIYAPFYSKATALETGRSFWLEYALKTSKACIFYTGILSWTFGMRHLMAENKDSCLFEIQYRLPFLRKYRAVQDVMLYCGFSWPIGFAINYMHTGRWLRGGPTLTLIVALVIRAMDGGQGLE